MTKDDITHFFFLLGEMLDSLNRINSNLSKLVDINEEEKTDEP